MHNLPISWLQSALRSLEHGRLECHPALPQTESLRDCMERTIPFYKVVVVEVRERTRWWWTSRSASGSHIRISSLNNSA